MSAINQPCVDTAWQPVIGARAYYHAWRQNVIIAGTHGLMCWVCVRENGEYASVPNYCLAPPRPNPPFGPKIAESFPLAAPEKPAWKPREGERAWWGGNNDHPDLCDVTVVALQDGWACVRDAEGRHYSALAFNLQPPRDERPPASAWRPRPGAKAHIAGRGLVTVLWSEGNDAWVVEQGGYLLTTFLSCLRQPAVESADEAPTND